MTDKQLPPDWAIGRAAIELSGDGAEFFHGRRYISVEKLTTRARELSAQQPDAARGEPKCPACDEVVQFECIACSTNNYPQTESESEQPDRDGDRFRGSATVDYHVALSILQSAYEAGKVGHGYSAQAVELHDAILPQPADGEEYEFEVWQNDEMQAGGSGPAHVVGSEAAHYAAIYSQDGPVEVRYYARRRIDETVLSKHE